jgi:NhaP-type Na+/H+ or K+/H+ antiporter
MVAASNPNWYGWSLTAFQEDHHVIMSSYFLIVVTLLIVWLAVQQQYTAWKFSYVPSAGITVLIGMAVSGIIRLAGGYLNSADAHTGFQAELLGFSPSIFYFAFLPLIIFEAGYHLKRRLFFENIGPVLLLAFLGTCISIIVFSTGIRLVSSYGLFGFKSPFTFTECICFGALISSTDPVSTLAVFTSLRVDPTLYYLVFGESVLNDAVAITVFTVTARYIGLQNSLQPGQIVIDCVVRSTASFIVSCILGYLCGILFAVYFKRFRTSDNKLFVVTTFMCMVYFPFFLSECLQMSGIVTVLFAGMSMRRYACKNISKKTRLASSFVLKAFVSVADICCFGFIGMSVFSQSVYDYDPLLICCCVFLIIISRALHVYPLLGLVSVLVADAIILMLCGLPQVNFARMRERKTSQQNVHVVKSSCPQRVGDKMCDSSDDMQLLNMCEAAAAEPSPVWLNPMVSIPVRLPLSDANVARPSAPSNDPSSPKMDCSGHSSASFVDEAQIGNHFPLSNISTPTIPLNTVHMIFLAGLRGAVSFACAEIFPDVNGNRWVFLAEVNYMNHVSVNVFCSGIVLSTTTAIIMFTVLWQASWNPCFLACLKIPTGVDTEAYLRQVLYCSGIFL